jgi:hypothetical protein
VTTSTEGAPGRRGRPATDDVSSSDSDQQTTDRPARLSVNMSTATEEALQEVAEREGVTVTEAVRRLVGYGHLLYRVTQIDGDEVLIRRGEQTERIVIIQ